MIDFILNDQDISTDLPPGVTVLDFVRYRRNLKGTKIGCREGDCGACTILVGELVNENVKYRSMTSCLMPLANAAAKHIVTIEGINPADGSLTPVQQAMVDESGTQCGFCTVGFVMSLTGFCIDDTDKTPEMGISAVDGNICRCTGYKSIERAAAIISRQLESDKQPMPGAAATGFQTAAEKGIIPKYFSTIPRRLTELHSRSSGDLRAADRKLTVGGGTDVYVQKPDVMEESDSAYVFYQDEFRGIRDGGELIELGSSTTVTDLLVSPVMRSIFPDLYKHLKLISSTPIRNMATLAGNFVNASPIGDMTVWFLALNAEIELGRSSHVNSSVTRTLPLKDLYLGYKQLTKSDDEIVTAIRFRKPADGFRFNFEKISKRTYLDIATVNTAISLRCSGPMPGTSIVPEFLKSKIEADGSSDIIYRIEEAHVAAGGVAPIPLYLRQTSKFLAGREVNAETIAEANEIMQTEISPISDVRGTEQYKRLVLRQLFMAHFVELFGINDPL